MQPTQLAWLAKVVRQALRPAKVARLGAVVAT
jgi:hypothetical protein